jgi:N-acetylneuraminate synthase
MSDRVLIIAEAGVNHNGSLDLALRLVDVAAAAGADAVKFQTFRADALAAASAPKAAYQVSTTGSDETQLDMLRKLELTPSMHREIAQRAHERRIEFLSTPFDEQSLEFLTRQMQLQTIKVPSGEITNGPLLLAVSRRAARVILSTGMSTLDEVETALGVLAFGFTAAPDERPGPAAFERAYATSLGRQALQERVVVLHCTSEYPAPVDEVNLAAMQTMRMAFGLPVGYSDHTVGIHIAIAAAAMGAVVIEKHFTLDRKMPGPDHRASLEPAELVEMVHCIRDVARAHGTGHKIASPSETATRTVARKSLVAARAVRAGETWDVQTLTSKRPAGGLSPMAYWDRIGTRVARDYQADESIE